MADRRTFRALQEIRAVYRHADQAYAPYSCPASGECCQLAKTGRQPWLWEPEWRLVEEAIAREGIALTPREDGGCPLLDAEGKRCRIYADRPFGCRTFFCSRIRGPSREPVDAVISLSRRLEKVALELDPEAKGPRPIFDWIAEHGEAVRLLVAPQELKGTLSASEAAAAIARGVREARPGIELVVAPLADGGPGTVEALLAGRGGRWHSTPVHDPLGARCAARWGLLDDGTAVIEMSAASGLSLLAGRTLRPLEASTRGTGELVRAALEAGARKLIVGLGGSATTDGGTGAICALGARFRDAEGHELPPGGGALEALAEIHVSRARSPALAASTSSRRPTCRARCSARRERRAASGPRRARPRARSSGSSAASSASPS